MNSPIKFPVRAAKQSQLEERMERLGVREQDLLEKFIRGSGAGGQKINKTSSTVYLRHEKSGFEVRCQESREQSLNRYYARVRLCDLIEEQLLGIESEKQKSINKIKRQKAKRSKRSKQKILDAKKNRSAIKKERAKPRVD